MMLISGSSVGICSGAHSHQHAFCAGVVLSQHTASCDFVGRCSI